MSQSKSMPQNKTTFCPHSHCIEEKEKEKRLTFLHSSFTAEQLSTTPDSSLCGLQKSCLLACTSGTSSRFVSAAGRILAASCFIPHCIATRTWWFLTSYTHSNYERFSNLNILVNLEECINSTFQIVQSVLRAKLLTHICFCLPKYCEILKI